MGVGIERRFAAPHPGPIIQRDFLDALGFSAPTLAGQLGMDPERLADMLAGRISFDVEAAIRLSRALQISPERIMQMQLRCDFLLAREIAPIQAVNVLEPLAAPDFPDSFLHGRLGRTGDERTGDVSLFFQEDVAPRAGDDYAGFHALWRGDRLRIYDPAKAVLWVGPILQNLDGHILLPFARALEWPVWFGAGYQADLAVGPEHAAFFERMREP